MENERLNRFGAELDRLADEYKHEVSGSPDTNLEVILYGIAKLVERDKRTQTHPLVISCLDSCSELLRRANYYASLK